MIKVNIVPLIAKADTMTPDECHDFKKEILREIQMHNINIYEFPDVSDEEVLITTVNQWFDTSIFYENSVKELYYPSINIKNFKKYNKKYFETFGKQSNEITILAYDAIGLIYYIWKKNGKIVSINDFFIKEKIKGKIGKFSFNNGIVNQELNIYKVSDNRITKN